MKWKALFVGTLEGWVRDPLTILINFAVLFYISPQLTFFIILSIPIIGFVLGRISRSLKKQSNEVAIKHGESVSALDETLSGLRVIKAFNVEALLKKKFFSVNSELLNAKNHIGYRRDLASPLSEFMGVVIFCGILWFGGQLVLKKELLEPSVFLLTSHCSIILSILLKHFPLHLAICKKAVLPLPVLRKY
jgi:subfamily B ATP-binding cassette protein MsbA